MRVVAGQRPGEDRRRRDGRRRGVREGPGAHRPREGASAGATASTCSCSARSRRSSSSARVFWFYGRERKIGLRPRVRAGAADRHGAGARADAAAAGRRGGVVRVHRDALRPDPPRRLHLDARSRPSARPGAACGARTSPISSSAPGKDDEKLTPWENAVARVVEGVIKDGPERLSNFRERIEDDRTAMSKHFTSFKANVGTEVGNRKWFISRGAVPLALALVLFVALGALLRLRRGRRLALGLPALERRRARRPRRRGARSTPRS